MTTDKTGGRATSRTAKILRVGAILLVVLAVLGVAGLQVLKGTTSSERLTEGVYLIHSESLLFSDGSNSLAVKTDAGVLLVDTQLPNWTPQVQEAVEEIFGQPVSLVVNTHWHADHSGGNDQLKTTAEILAHENVRKLLSGPHEGFGLTGPGSHHTYEGRAAAGLPDQVYENRKALPALANGGPVEAVHYPGSHTDGDTVVFVGGGRIVAVGDIVWPGAFPFVDVHNGGSATGILGAIDDILARTDRNSQIVAGHRRPITRGALLEYREMVSSTIGIVRAAINNGAELEAIVAAGLPAKYQAFASAVVPEEAWITMIYRSPEASSPATR